MYLAQIHSLNWHVIYFTVILTATFVRISLKIIESYMVVQLTGNLVFGFLSSYTVVVIVELLIFRESYK